MFLGNLSAVSENKERKKSSKKKKSGKGGKSPDDTGQKELTESGVMKRERVATKPVLYTAEAENVTRAALLEFLTTCKSMILDRENVREIVKDSIDEGIGLQTAAINYQRDTLENNFQIERNYGCKEMSMIPQKYTDDPQLTSAAKEFMHTAMRSYLIALDIRKEEFLTDQQKTPMRREQILEFFEACNARMSMQETKAELKEIYNETKKPPNERVIEMQHETLEKLGFDKDFGVACLNKIGQDFPGDTELHTKFQYFGASASLTCQEATFTEFEKKEFYSKIPPMMHAFPHIWVVQQQMQQQRQQQMMQQQQATGGNNNIDNLKKSGLLSLLSNPEGRLKVQNLGARIQNSRAKVEEEIKDWTKEKKQNFYDSFGDHPVVDSLNASEDPVDKINIFVELSDGDIDSMITLMTVLASEDGQAILEGEKEKRADGQKMSAVSSIIGTMGSLTNMKFNTKHAQQECSHNSGSHNHDHGHDHGHSHGHGGSCPMHGHGHEMPADVSTGFAAKMDR